MKRALDDVLRLAFLGAVYGPMLALVWLVAGASGGAVGLAWPDATRLALLGRSVALSLAVAAVATSAGFLVASRVAEGGRAARTVGWATLGLAAIPPYVHAQAWSAAASVVQRWLSAGGWQAPAFRGSGAVVWVEVSAFLPLAIGLGLVALATVPRHLVDAARISAGDATAFRRIVVPLAAPMLLAGAGLIFLLSLLDYSIPALYQVNVYALAVFTQYSATNRAAGAAVYALPLVAVSVAAVIATQAGLRSAAGRPPGAEGSARLLRLPLWLRGARATVICIAGAMLGLPLVVLARDAGGLGNFGATVRPAAAELVYSIGVALAAALLSLPLAWPAVRGLLARRSRYWWLVATLPLAVPAPLVGIGLIHLWNRPGLPFYGTTVMPVLAAVARFAPIAVLVLLAHGRRMDSALIDAARVHQPTRLRGWFVVVLPMWLPGLVAAGAVVFVLALGELGATLMIAPPGRSTLTMRIFNYLHYGASDTVAGLSLAMTALTAFGAVAGLAAFRFRTGLARLIVTARRV